MRCPFPGMDPYLERPSLWPDFHDRLITYISGTLQPVLAPRYAAVTQHRLVVVDPPRSVYPDVGVLDVASPVVEPPPAESPGTAAAVATDPDVITISGEDLRFEMLRQTYIEIVEPSRGARIVGVIEVLSPDNKPGGRNHNLYLRKQSELWHAGVLLVEIDLLSTGGRVVPMADGDSRLDDAVYVTANYLPSLHRCDVQRFGLSDPLPRLPVPLADANRTITLKLAEPFARAYETGPYPMMLRYDEDPPNRWSAEQRAWIREHLIAANLS